MLDVFVFGYIILQVSTGQLAGCARRGTASQTHQQQVLQEWNRHGSRSLSSILECSWQCVGWLLLQSDDYNHNGTRNSQLYNASARALAHLACPSHDCAVLRLTILLPGRVLGCWLRAASCCWRSSTRASSGAWCCLCWARCLTRSSYSAASAHPRQRRKRRSRSEWVRDRCWRNDCASMWCHHTLFAVRDVTEVYANTCTLGRVPIYLM
jgi:hypothetical protein